MQPHHSISARSEIDRPANLIRLSLGQKVDRPTNSLLGFALIVTLGACARPEADALEAAPLPVEVARIEVEEGYPLTRSLTGTVRSRRAANLGFERGGRVVEVRVEDGDRVRKGARLARLDVRPLLAQRERMKAGLRQAQAQRGLSDLTDERLARLAGEQLAPKQKADEARFGKDAARAKVEELEAALASLALDIERSVLVAPFDGAVTARLVDEGTVVGAGTPVLALLGEGGKEAFIGVPADLLEGFAPDAKVEVEIEGKRFGGSVSGRVDTLDPRSRTFGVIVALADAEGVRAGQWARVEARRQRPGRGSWVPHRALTMGLDGAWSLYVLRESEGSTVLSTVSVEVLHTAGERAFVAGGLESGDRYVTDGTHRVVPGQRVRAVGGQ